MRVIMSLLVLATMAACASSPRCEKEPACLQTERLPDLIVPTGLDKPPHDNAMAIPEEERLAYNKQKRDKDNRVCIDAPPPLETIDVRRNKDARQRTRDQVKRRSELNEYGEYGE